MMRSFTKLLFLCLFLFLVPSAVLANSSTSKDSPFIFHEFTCTSDFIGDLETVMLNGNGAHMVGNIICHETASLINCAMKGTLTSEGACIATSSNIEKIVMNGTACNLTDTMVEQFIIKAGDELVEPQTITLGGKTAIDTFESEVPVILIVVGTGVSLEGIKFEPGSYIVDVREAATEVPICPFCEKTMGKSAGIVANVAFSLKNAERSVAVKVGKNEKKPAEAIEMAHPGAVITKEKSNNSVWSSIPIWVTPACGAAVIIACITYVLTR